MELTKFFGGLFLLAGVVCWFTGAGKIVDRAYERLGIERREFPFAPYSIPSRKFNKQELRGIFVVFVVSMILLNCGTAFMRE
jgi:hypothetical protein